MSGDSPKRGDADRRGVDDEREAEDRDAILRRRARFVAAALGSILVGAASCEGVCQPCLSYGDGATGGGQGGAGGDGGAGGAGGEGGAPQPCLEVSPQATSSSSGEGGMPQPCLGQKAEGGGGAGGR
jgi:hypothetical protein